MEYRHLLSHSYSKAKLLLLQKIQRPLPPFR